MSSCPMVGMPVRFPLLNERSDKEEGAAKEELCHVSACTYKITKSIFCVQEVIYGAKTTFRGKETVEECQNAVREI